MSAVESVQETFQATGRVKWFNPTKGYGFLAQEDGPDIMLHVQLLKTVGKTNLAENSVVVGEVEKRDKGLIFTKIFSIEEAENKDAGVILLATARHGVIKDYWEGCRYSFVSFDDNTSAILLPSVIRNCGLKDPKSGLKVYVTCVAAHDGAKVISVWKRE